MEIQIRPGEKADFPALIELFKEFAAFERLPECMINSVDKMAEQEAFFNCFVAETGDKKIIGYATWFYGYYTWSGKSMYMDDLYVKPEYRGKEIGTRLINEIIRHAKMSGCFKLRWQVSTWNTPAIAFYKQVGADIEDPKHNCDLIF